MSDGRTGTGPVPRSDGERSLCECRQPRSAAAVISTAIEGNGHTYSCEKNPRNMPEWRVVCVGCGIPFETPIPADYPEAEYACEACHD